MYPQKLNFYQVYLYSLHFKIEKMISHFYLKYFALLEFNFFLINRFSSK